MRQKHQIQPTIQELWPDHGAAKELQAISRLLDNHPNLAAMVWQDLVAASGAETPQGAYGLTADQVLRALLVKQMNGFSYRELEFHLMDSLSYRRFCGLGFVDKCPSKSALQAAIKAIRTETLAAITLTVLAIPEVRKIEPGRQVRIDSTVVTTNIHQPTDSSLLWDCVRVLTRLMKQARKILGREKIVFSSRLRRAKRRHIGISNAKKPGDRTRLYRDLIGVAEETRAAAASALEQVKSGSSAILVELGEDLAWYLELTDRVLSQTRKRVLEGKKVPASEKIASIFEVHTDIIVKDRRETQFGHKICLTGGKSSLILDCVISDGNPADSTLAEVMIDRQVENFGRPPRQAAFDGGFASRPNLQAIKNKGVETVVFSKRRGIAISEMARSAWVFRRLRRFRAGIEGNISFLKRIFGLDRCTWRSLESFKSYVWSSILAFNLVIIARHLLS
jgi:IS5 family transposase